MKKLSILFLFCLLTLTNMSCGQKEINECFTFNDAEDYKKAIEVGKLAIEKYPRTQEPIFAWEKLIIMLENSSLLMRI